MKTEFNVGSIVIKIQRYRSQPKVNMTEDKTRITIDGYNADIRPLLRVLAKFPEMKSNWLDPNRGLNSKKWYRLAVTSGELIKRAINNEWHFEEWVSGTPGTDPNYIKVQRFVELDGDNGVKEHARIIFHGNHVISSNIEDLIGVAFIGEAYDPDFVYEYDEAE